MKTNVPEKIYIEVTSDGTRYYRDVVKEERTENTDIEYSRTDAFIDKVCEFLKSYRQDTPDGLGYIAGIVNDKTIEDLRRYLEK